MAKRHEHQRRQLTGCDDCGGTLTTLAWLAHWPRLTTQEQARVLTALEIRSHPEGGEYFERVIRPGATAGQVVEAMRLLETLDRMPSRADVEQTPSAGTGAGTKPTRDRAPRQEQARPKEWPWLLTSQGFKRCD